MRSNGGIMKQALFSIAIMVGIGLISANALAQVVWKNTAGGDFNTGANWNGGIVPTSAQQASFISNANYTVTFSSAFVTNSSATFNATTGATVTFNLAGNPWNIADRVWIGSGAGNPNNHVVLTGGGAFNMYGGGSDLMVGVHQSNNSLLITNASQVYVGRTLYVGGQNATLASSTNNLLRVTGLGSALSVVGSGYLGGTGDFNRVSIENDAVASMPALYIGGNNINGTPDAGGNSNSVTVSGGSLNLTGNLNVGSYGVGNSLLVTGGGVVSNAISYVGVNGTFSSLTIQTNGTYFCPRLTIGVAAGSSDNYLTVIGSGSSLQPGGGSANDINVGYHGSRNTLSVLDGGMAAGKRHLFVGGGAGATLASTGNLVRVSGAGSTLAITNDIYVGTLAGSEGHRLTIEDGGNVSCVDAQIGVNGSGHSALVTGGGLWTNSGTYFRVGKGGSGHSLTVHSNGQIRTTYFFVGDGGTSSLVTVGAGGDVQAKYTVRMGTVAASSSNRVEVAGAGAQLRAIDFDVDVGNASAFNSLTVSNGGLVVAKRSVNVGTATATATNNSLLVGPGGWLETGVSLVVGTAGGNTITNQGGVMQFTMASPTISNGGSAANIAIEDGTVSFRAISDASVLVSGSGGALDNTKVTWIGDNTFMLNAATNINNANQAYTFQPGNPTNFARLALINSSTYRGGAVTIGSGGALVVSNGVSTISTDLALNAGGTFVVQAGGRAGAVLNAGGAVALGGATLELTLGAKPALNVPIVIINKTSGGAVSSAFGAQTVYAEYGDKMYSMHMVYDAGDNNDVGVVLRPLGTLISIQ